MSGYVHDEGYGVTPQPAQIGNVTGPSCSAITSVDTNNLSGQWCSILSC